MTRVLLFHLLFELFDSKTLQRIGKRWLNSLNINSLHPELWKSISNFFLNEATTCAVLHISNVWFTANDVLPAPMCFSKTAKNCFSKKINMAAKRSHSGRLLKLKYEVLQELDKRTPPKDLAEKYSIPKNTISTWKENSEKILACYEKGLDSKRIKPVEYNKFFQENWLMSRLKKLFICRLLCSCFQILVSCIPSSALTEIQKPCFW